ncbi:UNVERIFIED_CONTAM: hypothetical protein K2H54_058758 [Gekko kuhli]
MELTAIKILFMVFGSILACVTSILVARYNLWHKILFKIWTWIRRMRRGMKVKYAKHNGYNFCYFTRGKPGSQPSMLMLHGFSLSKDMWLDTLKSSKEKEDPRAVSPPSLSQQASIERLRCDSFLLSSSVLMGCLVGVGGNVAQAAQVAVAAAAEAWEEEAPSPHLDTSQFPRLSGAHGGMLCRHRLKKPITCGACS